MLTAPVFIALAPEIYKTTESIVVYVIDKLVSDDKSPTARSTSEVQENLNPGAIEEKYINEVTRAGYSVLDDFTKFDMRRWKEMKDPNRVYHKYSPVEFENTLRVVKTDNIDSIKVYFATSGTGIENLHCSSYQGKLRYQISKRNEAHKVTYELSIDVSQEPVNKPFNMHFSGTYWDSFKEPMNNWVETYTDDDIQRLQRLKLLVVLPQNLKPENLQYAVTTGSDYKNYVKFTGASIKSTDSTSNELTWDITNPVANKMYKLTWAMMPKDLK